MMVKEKKQKTKKVKMLPKKLEISNSKEMSLECATKDDLETQKI